MTTIPESGYFINSNRTNVEAKTAQDLMLEVLRELVGGSAPTELTISAGVVTPTSTSHTIDTEGDASSDFLDNAAVTNTPAGRFLYLRAANSGRTINIRHQQGGAGQFVSTDGNDIVLNDTKFIVVFELVGTQWVERWRWLADNHSAWRAYLGLEDLSTQSSSSVGVALNMNAQPINQAKAPSIESATNIDIVNIAGNSVEITGTNAIESLGVGQGGIQRTLIAKGVFSLIHDATSLILPTEADLTTQVNDTIWVTSLGSGNWIVTGWQRADGTALATPPQNPILLASVVGTGTEQFLDFSLPPGYDEFELLFHGAVCSGANAVMELLFSQDGGSTFYDTNTASTRQYTQAAMDEGGPLGGNVARTWTKGALGNAAVSLEPLGSTAGMFGYIRILGTTSTLRPLWIQGRLSYAQTSSAGIFKYFENAISDKSEVFDAIRLNIPAASRFFATGTRIDLLGRIWGGPPS